MQSYLSDHRGYKEESYSVVEEDYIFRDEHSYNNGSTGHMMKPADHCPPKQSYSQNHGHAHGGYNNHDNKGHVAQYSSGQARYEEDRQHDGWGVKNDHYGHGGGNSHYNGSNYPHREGMNHGGYGGHQGQYGHHREGMKMNHGGYGGHQGHNGHYYPEERKRVSVWDFKSIVD